jgi:hypothetical protein
MNAVVFGGYGTFGSHVCRELVRRGVPVIVAGRDRGRAETFARTLGRGSRGIQADVTNRSDCRAALSERNLAVNCAGPFQDLDATLLETCLDLGCHYVDIADDRAYAALVRRHDDAFHSRGLAAVYGCSSLPGISGALALRARAGVAAPIQRVRVTLFIGNNNPKGEAAVRSLLAGLGRPIAAPQGVLHGFRDREVVPLPPPFGPRAVFNMESPEYDLFPSLLGAAEVGVKLGFGLPLVTYGLAFLAWLGSGYGKRMARLLGVPGRLLQRFGCSGGAVMTELFLADGSVRRATMLARRDGQRMAALPCAMAAERLWAMFGAASKVAVESHRPRGALTAYEFLGCDGLIAGLVATGFELC